MSQFFAKKHQDNDLPACFFKKLVGGLEANNYEKENFKNVIGKVLFGKKKVNESISFLLIE
jgi:hypothetical protein